MPTILDRVASLWQRRNATPPPVTTVPTPPTLPGSLSFTAQRDRRAVVTDSRDMLLEDPRPKQALATLARDVTKGGFTLSITGPRAAQAQAAADALMRRLRLTSRLDDWARLTFRDGDTFLELGVAANGEIVEVTRKPALEMFRWSDDFDRLYDPARAYYWTERPTFTGDPPGDAIFFAEWQMVHARWDRDEGSRYGNPMFAAARKAYKRMSQGELDVAVRRKTRSGLRYHHVLEGANPAEMEAYKAANKPALDDPFAAVADFFSNKEGGLKVVQGDAHLSEIDDVLHHVDTFGMASPVPLELIGYGRNLNRDVLAEKKEQYGETLGAVRAWLEWDLIRPILERQWLFLGIWPDALEVDVQWKDKKEASATELAEMARFAATVKAGGLLTTPTLLRIMATRLPDFDVDAELLALQAEEAERAAQAQEMARVAANALAAGGEDAPDSDGEDGE